MLQSFIDQPIHRTGFTTVVSENISHLNVYLVKPQESEKLQWKLFVDKKISQFYFQILHLGKISIKYVWYGESTTIMVYVWSQYAVVLINLVRRAISGRAVQRMDQITWSKHLCCIRKQL